jgi:hypothetical protein
MSQRSQDNAVIHAIGAKLDAMESTVVELETNKKMIEKLRDTSDDDRVIFNATKLLHETELKITELRFRIFEHDNPATQKSEVLHKGLPEIPATLTVIIAKDKK